MSDFFIEPDLHPCGYSTLQVLFMELKLPPSGDPANPTAGCSKTLGPARGRGGRRRVPFSTSKDILEKLKPLHPLPALLLEWRRLTAALTKVICPLVKEKVYCPHLDMDRIHSLCQTHTATGRVSMAEPNLQNIPKDFEIDVPGKPKNIPKYFEIDVPGKPKNIPKDFEIDVPGKPKNIPKDFEIDVPGKPKNIPKDFEIDVPGKPKNISRQALDIQNTPKDFDIDVSGKLR